jgi:hypothetical protein
VMNSRRLMPIPSLAEAHIQNDSTQKTYGFQEPPSLDRATAAFLTCRVQIARRRPLMKKLLQVAFCATSLETTCEAFAYSVQRRVIPVRENRVIAGIDHSGWPTSLNAAMNKSPQTAIIAIISN